MRITILGSGPLAQPLSQLAERAGHTVRWMRAAPAAPVGDQTPDLVVLAGSRAAVEPLLANLAESIPHDVILVDATTPTQDERVGARPSQPGSQWIAGTVPHARIVRAFASVPAEALTAVLNAPESEPAARVAVPLAGDNGDAKAVVERFMREIGVDPFDLGALATSYALDPGGPLWGKALSPVEMLEAVGRLSGDG